MKRTLSEQKVLKKLGIPDFRHLSKDNVVKLATLLPKMDPEVAKKSLEQFPNFEETSLGLVQEYGRSFEILTATNKDSGDHAFASFERTKNILEKELERGENLTFEQRAHIVDQILKVDEMIAELHKDTVRGNVLGYFAIGGTIIAALGTAASILGLTTHIQRPHENEEDEYEEIYE